MKKFCLHLLILFSLHGLSAQEKVSFNHPNGVLKEEGILMKNLQGYLFPQPMDTGKIKANKLQ